jgi:type IV pilus assembly protein PilV
MKKFNFNRSSSLRLIRGVSLIEVMVSVLILSIGLLGIAAMQATALRNTQSSMERSQAVIYSYSIIDAMRANIDAARANQYNVAWTCAAPAATSLATSDINNWITQIRAQGSNLKDGCGRITCASNVCTVDVRWNDSRASGNAVQLTSYSVSTVSRL